MRVFLVLALVALVATACSPKREVKIKTEDGDTVALSIDQDGNTTAIETDGGEMAFGENVQVDVWPTGFSQLPGSTITAFAKLGSGDATTEPTMLMIAQKSSLPISDILAAYRKQVTEAGYTVDTEVQEQESAMLAAKGATETDFVMIMVNKNYDSTEVVIQAPSPNTTK
jgi:hypothetical protein